MSRRLPSLIRRLPVKRLEIAPGFIAALCLLRLLADERNVRLDLNEKPEFDRWQWVDFWYPFQHVVDFKREVYRRALNHVAPKAQAVAANAPILGHAPGGDGCGHGKTEGTRHRRQEAAQRA